MEKDWKLKLRYGKITTPFKHYSMIAEVLVGDLQQGFECPPGKAIVGMKVWATDTQEAANMLQGIGNDIGYEVVGDIQLYDTPPEEAPTEDPFAYGINFHPFKD